MNDDITKILVRGPNWLGDAIMALPAIGSLSACYPKAAIDLALPPPFADLGELLPIIRKTFPTPGREEGWGRYRQRAREGAYDLALIFPSSFRSAIELTGCGVHRRAGFAGDLRSLFLTDPIPQPLAHSCHQSDAFMALVRWLKKEAQPVWPAMAIPDRFEREGADLLAPLTGPLAGIGFGASYGQAKMWPADRFAALIDRLREEGGLTPVLIGAAAEREIADAVLAMTKTKPPSLVGQTSVGALAAVMRRLAVHITNDTGPMHLAAALDVPTVALFGPTSPAETAPAGAKTHVIWHGVECAPCWKRVCPTDHHCMTAITVDEAFEKALDLAAPDRAE